jgi:hypothetical protein
VVLGINSFGVHQEPDQSAAGRHFEQRQCTFCRAGLCRCTDAAMWDFIVTHPKIQSYQLDPAHGNVLPANLSVRPEKNSQSLTMA